MALDRDGWPKKAVRVTSIGNCAYCLAPGMLTLYVASSLILSTPLYVITPWLHIITPHHVVTPQLCHYSTISQSHVYILEFYLGEPQLELT
jgi:hypothetical protein